MSNIRASQSVGRWTAAAVTAATAAALLPAVAPAAAILNITGITTRTDVGVPLSVSGVAGLGQTSSAYKTSSVYTMTFGGDDQKLLSVTAGGTTYSASGMANNVVRRYQGPNNDTLWYATKSAPSASGSTIAVAGPALGGFTQAFDTNNVLVGADNLFVNTGNPVGNNADVSRLDMLFSSGIVASARSAFAITDRGPTNDHDAFKIAAVTKLDASGNPSAYGAVLSYADGTWGTTDLVKAGGEVVVRRDDSAITPTATGGGSTGVNASPTLFHPSDYVDQPVGGVVIPTSSLVPAGTTIYGYSLFAPTVTGTGSQLVNWQNGTYYKPADYTSHGGGLDPTATLAVLFTAPAPVPEPTTLGLAAVAGVGLLARRRRS